MITRLRRLLLIGTAATLTLAACAGTRSESGVDVPAIAQAPNSTDDVGGQVDSTNVPRSDEGVDITSATPDGSAPARIDQLDPETSSILSAFLPGSYSGIDDAHGRLVAVCMQNLGFEHDLSHGDHSSDVGAESFLATDIGLRTVEQAQRVGYGPLGTEAPMDEPDPASLTPEYLSALLGPDYENPTYVEITVPPNPRRVSKRNARAVAFATRPRSCMAALRRVTD